MAWLTGWNYRKQFTLDAPDGQRVWLNLGDDTDIRAHGSFLDGRDIRAVAADETTVLDYELVPDGQFMGVAQGWTWFNGPESIRANGITHVGAISTRGDIVVSSYNNSSKAFTQTILTAAVEANDHSNPSLCYRSDGKLLVGYTKVSTSELYVRFKISSSADNTTAWGSEIQATITGASKVAYCNLERLSGEGTGSGRIYCFLRDSDRYLTHIYSDDDGATWTGGQRVWDSGASTPARRPYLRCYGNGSNRVDWLFTFDHPGAATPNYKVYHVYYDGTWRNSNGDAITENDDGSTAITLPFSAADLDASSLVYDGTAATETAWIWDVVQASGTPHILYSRFPSNDTTNHDYYYAKFSGGAWSSVKLADAGTYLYSGEPYYSGGMCFEDDDPAAIYLSLSVSSIYEISRWTTSNGGANWSKTLDITSGSTYHNFRPNCPRGFTSGDRITCLWVGSGPYTSYADYETAIRIYPGIRGRAHGLWCLPPANSSATKTVYVYYGKADATDAQDAATLWSGYTFVIHGPSLNDWRKFLDSTGNGWHCNTTTNTANTTPIWRYDHPLPHFSHNLAAGTPERHRIYKDDGTNLNFAGATELCLEAWLRWTNIDSARQCFFCPADWDTSKAELLFRINPASSNALEGYVIREANTQYGGTLGSLTVSENAWHYVAMLFDADKSDNYDVYGRVDKTEDRYGTTGSAAAIDATASNRFEFGRQHTSTNPNYFRGYGSELRLTIGGLVSQTITDATYDNLYDYAAFVTTGTEQSIGVLSGAASVAITPTGSMEDASETGGISGASSLSVEPVGTLTGSGALAGAVSVLVDASGGLGGTGALAGSGTITVSAAGVLAGSVAMTATTDASLSLSGALAASGALAGATTITITATGTLEAPAGALAGSATVEVAPSGTLAAAGALAGAITVAIAAAGTLDDGLPDSASPPYVVSARGSFVAGIQAGTYAIAGIRRGRSHIAGIIAGTGVA